ncbi:MAG: hypothetical protein V4704_05685 [Pseudomonadota bacterium]
MTNSIPRIAVGVLAAALLAGCQRDAAPPSSQAQAPQAANTVPAAPVALEDVVETRSDYIIGITYPKSAAAHPGLAQALQAYANAARSKLMQAVAGLKGVKPSAPYDLSLQFTGLLDTPALVVVAADGSSYTGGAHGNPLVARFVWLPPQKRMLTAEALVPDKAGWQAISDASREQLMTLLSQRLDGDDLAPADYAGQLQSGSKAIADGTAPDASNFSEFEPVVDADGRIRALRFVFPPYQVGSYSDGTRTVDIPAATLLPVVDPQYRSLFRGG